MPRTSIFIIVQFLRALLAALVIAPLVGASAATAAPAAKGAAAPPANPAAPVILTPTQARSALQVLDDPTQRAHIEDTLRAIAAAGALATPASAPASASATGSTSASPRSAASAPLAQALRTNGLVLQISAHVAHSAQMLVSHLLRSRTALFDLPSAHAWWNEKLHTQQGRKLLTDILRVLVLTLVPALLLEMLMRRFVDRPRRSIAAHAATVQAAREPQSPQAASDAVSADATARTADAAAAQANAQANATASTAQDGAESRESQAQRERQRQRSALHWSLLQRLPAALLVMLLNLLPIAVFGLCAAGIMSLADPADSPVASAIGEVVDTYVICRVLLVLSALFFAPQAAALRLTPLNDTWAAFAQRWATRLVIVGGIGGVLNGAVPIGMTEEAHLALVKIIALVDHLMLAVAIFQCRRPVAALLRRPAEKGRSLSWLAHWFADIWAGVAIFVVMALWLVWALDLRGGYRELTRAVGLSLVVLLAARMIAIIALGALGRIFDPIGNRANLSIAQRRVYRYYPVLRRIVTLVVWLVTLDVLLPIWDVHPSHLFINAPIGHLLGSALITIVIAVVIAIVIWEAANGAAERRLESWSEAGDYVRAARLRTLLPMLRTSLLVAILIVVGLTALSEIGINTAPLVAGASIFGVALGFGSQKLVQDFITGIFLLTENAMQVGDWVTVAGVSGTVEFLSIRTVRLRGGDGSLYTVPFSSVTTVNNTNRGIGNAAVKVVISYGADVKRAVETLQEIGRDLRNDSAFNKGILSDFAYWGVDQVDGAGVTLVGQIQCTDSTRWSVQREFNRRVLEHFTERGIELANPQRNFLVHASSVVEANPDEMRRREAAATPATSGNGSDRTPARPEQAPDNRPPSGSTADARGTSPGSKPSL